MQRLVKLLFVPLFVLFAALFFSGCELLKLSKILYEECLGPADEDEEIPVLYKFDEDFFVPPGRLTMKTRASTEDRQELLPPAMRFRFVYKDRNTTLFEFQDDLDFDNNGRLPTLTLNFLDPGVQFRKKQTIRLSFAALFDRLVLSNFRYNFKYTANDLASGILPLKPVRPSGAPMSISVGGYEDF